MPDVQVENLNTFTALSKYHADLVPTHEAKAALRAAIANNRTNRSVRVKSANVRRVEVSDLNDLDRKLHVCLAVTN